MALGFFNSLRLSQQSQQWAPSNWQCQTTKPPLPFFRPSFFLFSYFLTLYICTTKNRKKTWMYVFIADLARQYLFLVAEKFRNSFFLAVNASEKKISKLSEQIKNVF